MIESKRVYISKENIKIVAVNFDVNDHRELEFDMNILQQHHRIGYKIYATNCDGVFFFINNIDGDGKDWCKITKV